MLLLQFFFLIFKIYYDSYHIIFMAEIIKIDSPTCGYKLHRFDGKWGLP